MDHLRRTIKYLKDPIRVSNFQKSFGIKALHHTNEDKDQIRTFINKTELDSNNRGKYNYHKTSSDEENNVKEDNQTSKSTAGTKNFIVQNKFWYYFFFIGTYIGDEIFYSIYFPFWFWNIDYVIARRIITVWAIIMYIGQALKDVIKWPRPMCPPAVRVQAKWSLEYGMPSTHAMIAVAIPLSTILFTMEKYDYSLPLSILVALLACLWVCTSRIYLGMHTVLDVVVGVLLASFLLVVAVPLLIYCDSYAMSWRWTPIVIITLTLSLVIFYPTCDIWTPTRGDTTTVLGCIAGIYLGAAVVNHAISLGELPHAYPIEYLAMWPKLQNIAIYFVRFLAGILVIILFELLLMSATHFIDRMLGLDPNETRIQRKQRLPGLDLTYKYISYLILGFTVAMIPLFLNIGFNIDRLL